MAKEVKTNYGRSDNEVLETTNLNYAQAVVVGNASDPDVIIADLIPGYTGGLINNLQVDIELDHGANTIDNPTFQLGTSDTKVIGRGLGAPLAIGDTGGVGYTMRLKYSAVFDMWIIQNPYNKTETNTYFYTADDTYTPKAGTTYIEIQAIGGGGGAGGVDGQGAGTVAITGGGGAGAYCFKATRVIDPSYALVVGSGGNGGAAGNNDGVAGEDSTVTSSSLSMVAGGGAKTNGVTAFVGVPGSSGGLGGTASGGDINANGASGESGSGISSQSYNTGNTNGGSSFLSGGQGQNGLANYGAGGGGTHVKNTTTNIPGGDGGDGIIIVKEFRYV